MLCTVTIPPTIYLDAPTIYLDHDAVRALDVLGQREGPSFSRAGGSDDHVRSLSVILDAETANDAARIVAEAIDVDPDELEARPTGH